MWKSACICFGFVKIYVILYYIIVWKAAHKTKVIISEQWDEGEIFHFHFLQFLLCTLLKKFFFFQACQETVRAPSGPVGPLSLTFVFEKPIPSFTALPWIRDPRPPQTASHWPILLPFGHWINTSGDPPTALLSTSARRTKELSQWPSPITFAFSKDNAG